MRRAIIDFKYNNFKALCSSLAGLLAEYVEHNSLPGEVLVPVSLHSKRMRSRGYNQSGLLCRELSKLNSLPVIDDSLVRLKDTPAQTKASSAEVRRRNVEGAFACRGDRFKGKKILLIDDVCTTGATLDSCASALKNAGASSVWGLTLAREV
jgi:ComF family protein